MRYLVMIGFCALGFAGDAHLQNGQFTARLNGGTLAYTVAGNGPPMMVLTNSWGLQKEALRTMFSPLEDHFQLMYFDLRGLGGSSPAPDGTVYDNTAIRADCEALRTHLGLDKVYLLGWSAGAMNGLLYAAEHADALYGAILVHGIAFVDPAMARQLGAAHGPFFQRRAEVVTRLMRGNDSLIAKNHTLKRFIIDDWFPYLCADREAGKALIKGVLEPHVFSWPHMQASFQDLGTFDARAALPRISCPTLVIAGAHDLLPPEVVQQDAAAMPHARFAAFAHSGHFAMLEEPAAFMETVLSWAHDVRAQAR